MRSHLTAAAVLALAACGPSTGTGRNANTSPGPTIVTAEPGATRRWMANLSPVGGSTVRGTAMLAGVGKHQMMQLSITGGSPAAAHPWHVHTGTCSEGMGSIVGAAQRYTALGTDNDGNGSMSSELPSAIGSGSYHVSVHASLTDMTVVACGDLGPHQP